jgi:hypothetical protein
MKISKSVLFACSLSTIVGTFSSCSRAQYTPPTKSVQAGATAGASVSALDGYWVEQAVPAGVTDQSGNPSKPTAIFISNGKIFNLVKYSDGQSDQLDVQATIPTKADAKGNWTISGYEIVVTISLQGNILKIHDAESAGSTLDVSYTKSDLNTATQNSRQLWFKKAPSYQYCDAGKNNDIRGSQMKAQILQFVMNDLKQKGTSLDQIATIRNTGGKTVSSCEIMEGYLERGLDFAKTGQTPPDLSEIPNLTVSIDASSDLLPITDLEIANLTLNSSDQAKSLADLSPLRGMTGLKSLTLNGLKMPSVNELNQIDSLSLSSMSVSDLTVFVGFLTQNPKVLLNLNSVDVPANEKDEDTSLKVQYPNRYNSKINFK